MTPRLAIRTRLLIAAAAALWAVDVAAAVLHWPEQLRSISQGIAVATTVLAGIVTVYGWERDRRAAGVARLVYVSMRAPDDAGSITMEIPRIRPPAMAISGGARPRRSQEYWDAAADIAETLLERREDDPDSST